MTKSKSSKKPEIKVYIQSLESIELYIYSLQFWDSKIFFTVFLKSLRYSYCSVVESYICSFICFSVIVDQETYIVRLQVRYNIV